jgi:hypothetical protein
MGQQQEIAAGSALRRMISVLMVAAVVALLMTASAMPAMAGTTGNQHPGPPLQSGHISSNNITLASHNIGGTCAAHSGDKSGTRAHGPGC